MVLGLRLEYEEFEITEKTLAGIGGDMSLAANFPVLLHPDCTRIGGRVVVAGLVGENNGEMFLVSEAESVGCPAT